jgi:hypothetical protein
VSEEELTKSLALGAAACFSKPNGITELVDLVRQWKGTYIDASPAPQFARETVSASVLQPLGNFSAKYG